MTRRFQLMICALFVLSVAGHFALTSAGPQAQQDQPAENFYKKIQALKGVPASQVLKLMIAYDKALGVDCDYCHTFPDLADDSKPAHKDARHDILMIGKIKTEDQRSVDCMTCHQGKAKISGDMGDKGDPPLPPQPPKPLPPKPVAYGDVLFPHDLHMHMDCTKCHHTGENSKCDACHLHNKKPSQVTQISFYTVAHDIKGDRACTGCHLQMKAGPTKCAQCHEKMR